VIDMLEQGLDAATQEALIADLRRRGPNAKPLFFLTRSSAILDLYSVGVDEAIILCPANHSPPSRVIPIEGLKGTKRDGGIRDGRQARERRGGSLSVLWKNIAPGRVATLTLGPDGRWSEGERVSGRGPMVFCRERLDHVPHGTTA
jgi:hypothetical protein